MTLAYRVVKAEYEETGSVEETVRRIHGKRTVPWWKRPKRETVRRLAVRAAKECRG